jgi:translation initiation factor 2 beta subunit (eIF-2beta)/eIF-5
MGKRGEVTLYVHCSSCGGSLEALLHGDGIYVDSCEKCTGRKGTLEQMGEEIEKGVQ